MATEFTVLDTKMIITDLGVALPTESAEWRDMMSREYVDLSRSDGECLLVFAKLPAVAENVYSYGTIQCKAKALIALVQDSIEQQAKEDGIEDYQSDIDGVYNCKDAASMVTVAYLARGEVVTGDADFWPLTPTELIYLLNRSLLVQALIAQAVQDAGNPTQPPNYIGSAVVVPAQEVEGMTFISAPVPSVCEGTVVEPPPPIGPTHECPTGMVWDPSMLVCAKSGTTPTSVVGKKDEGYSQYIIPGVIGLGIVGAVGYAWSRSRKNKARVAFAH